MANELTYSRIKYLLPEIWEAALFFLEYAFVMPGTVTVFSDQEGFTPRNVSEYIEGTIQTNLAELQDLTPSLLTRQLLARLTPKENGVQYLITDRRTSTDDSNIAADAAMAIAYGLGKQLEKDLLGDFTSLTGGLIDKGGSSLTWADLYAGRALLRANAVPPPYNVVLHEYQWLDLATAANIAAIGITTVSQPQLQIRDQIQNQYYVGSLNDMNIFVTGLSTISSSNVYGAIYNRNAFALDMRQGLRIEPFRDPSLRAGELNGTMVYAHGIWRPTWGVQIKSDATAPGSAVTQTSVLVVTGVVDDTTVSAAQVANYTFTVTNTGSVVARGIIGTITVPANFVYASASASMGSFDSTAKTWGTFDLAPGQTAQLQLGLTTGGTGTKNTVLTIVANTVTPNLGADAAITVAVTAS